MSQNENEDDFNIYDFIIMLYEHKITILIFVLIGISTTIFTYTKKIQYEISIIIDNPPPQNNKDEKTFNHLLRLFYDEKTFANWDGLKKSSFQFKDIKKSFEENGINLIKSEGDLPVSFKSSSNPEGGNYKYIALLSLENDKHINDIYNYLNYLNDIISNDYKRHSLREKKLLINMEEKSNLSNQLITNDRFISFLEENMLVYFIERPKKINKQTPKIIILQTYPVFLSLLFGIIFVTFRSGFQNHIKQRKKT